MNYQELMEELADLALKKLDLVQRKALPAPEVKTVTKSESYKNSRYIPSKIKQFVWRRDQGQCQFQDTKTDRKCCSKHFIQIDHIKPFSVQGSSQDPANLRLLCGQHNRWRYNQEGCEN